MVGTRRERDLRDLGTASEDEAPRDTLASRLPASEASAPYEAYFCFVLMIVPFATANRYSTPSAVVS